MIVVSDSSPLIALDAIGQLDLLRHLYGVVLIPPKVQEEIRAGEGGELLLRGAPWIETRSLSLSGADASVLVGLDAGEAEAIALALQVHADLLLMDERRGRAAAERLGLRRIGLVGVVLAAKRDGLIPSARPLLDDLVHRAGLWVGDDVFRDALDAAGE